MTFKFNKVAVVAMLACTALTACSDDDDDDGMEAAGGGDPVVETSDFAFNDTAFADYTRVDRQGMPAVATVLIDSKDSYNLVDPVDDADLENNPFVGEIIASLTTLHTALDDDLMTAELTPCTVLGDGMGTCVATAGPLILPDTISIDTSVAAGFPNGRRLTDEVIDITLAVALLELTGDTTQTPASLIGTNPVANDLPFKAEFPFLADPQQAQ